MSVLPVTLDKKFKLAVRNSAKSTLRTMDAAAWKKFEKLHHKVRKFGSVLTLSNMLDMCINFVDGSNISGYGAKAIKNYIFLISFDRMKLTIHEVIDIVRLRRSSKVAPCLVHHETKEISGSPVEVSMHVFPQGLSAEDHFYCGIAISWAERVQQSFVRNVTLAHAYLADPKYLEFDLVKTETATLH